MADQASLRAPIGLQEASKRLSDGFRVEDAIRTPFGTDFWLQIESLGPKKSLKSLQRSSKYKVLLFSALIVFGPRFETLLGCFGEGIWPPINSKPVSSVPSGRPRADSTTTIVLLSAWARPKRGRQGSKMKIFQERTLISWHVKPTLQHQDKDSQNNAVQRHATSSHRKHKGQAIANGSDSPCDKFHTAVTLTTMAVSTANVFVRAVI